MAELKIWIVMRQDLEMPLGKAIAQGGHAVDWTLAAAARQDEPSHPNHHNEEVGRVERYRLQNTPKITVKAKNLAAMKRAFDECKEANIPCSFVVDEGRTIFAEPTATAVGIGPCYYEELPKFVQRLQLLG